MYRISGFHHAPFVVLNTMVSTSGYAIYLEALPPMMQSRKGREAGQLYEILSSRIIGPKYFSGIELL